MRGPRSRTTGVVSVVVAVTAGLLGWFLLSSSPRTVTTSDAVLLVSGRTGGGMEMAAGGPLALGPTGCLGIAGEDGSFTTVVFPHGTILETADPLVVRLGGQSVALGDRVDLGGGSTSASDDLVPSEARTRCDAEAVFLAADLITG